MKIRQIIHENNSQTQLRDKILTTISDIYEFPLNRDNAKKIIDALDEVMYLIKLQQIPNYKQR